MSVEEKIKWNSDTLPIIIRGYCEKAWKGICANCLADCEFEGEKTYAGKFIQETDVLKILEDHKQKLRELADLTENYPKLHANSSLRQNSIINALITDYETHFKKIKKFVELGLDTKKKDIKKEK